MVFLCQFNGLCMECVVVTIVPKRGYDSYIVHSGTLCGEVLKYCQFILHYMVVAKPCYFCFFRFLLLSPKFLRTMNDESKIICNFAI